MISHDTPQPALHHRGKEPYVAIYGLTMPVAVAQGREPYMAICALTGRSHVAAHCIRHNRPSVAVYVVSGSIQKFEVVVARIVNRVISSQSGISGAHVCGLIS